MNRRAFLTAFGALPLVSIPAPGLGALLMVRQDFPSRSAVALRLRAIAAP